MKKLFSSKPIILASALFFGLAILGYSIFKGLKTFSDKDRVVTVKGLAEMNMTAVSATITLDFSLSGNDVQELIKKTEKKKRDILERLTALGIAKNEITINSFQVVDRERYTDTKWMNGKEVEVKIDRYTISQSLSFQTEDVEGIEDKAAEIKLDLVSKDLNAQIETTYWFPELNSIKPQLIEESTKNARIAGEQFANDSQAKLGKIKTASQGQISIVGQYYYDSESSSTPKEPYIQKARVVSTIVFFLE